MVMDDIFIRRFMTGTWHDLFVSEVGDILWKLILLEIMIVMYMTLISANQVSYMDAAIHKHCTLRSLFLFAGDNQETT